MAFRVTDLGRFIFLAIILFLGFRAIRNISSEGGISNVTRETWEKWCETTRPTFKSPPTPAPPIDYDTEPPAHTIPASPPYSDDPPIPIKRANATFVILARNGDLRGVLASIKQNEDRWNRKYKYPYVFLNEEPFTEKFKKLTTQAVSSETRYGLIPKEQWFQPAWIDEVKATRNREKAVKDQMLYGGSVPYRNMCRFNSGFFFKQKELLDFRYYWRIEPDIKFYCDLNHDPFLFMEENKKVYGFTVALYELPNTIPTLWETVKEFIQANPQYIAKDNLMGFLSDDGGENYNRCHFWSNFEIGDMDFWRGEAYQKFFEHLENKGGFYYERWGDAPVHSIAAALFLNRNQFHFFKDIGYRHEPIERCPQGDFHSKGKCSCDPEFDHFDYNGYSCLPRYEKFMGKLF